jgi:hypothetical protein
MQTSDIVINLLPTIVAVNIRTIQAHVSGDVGPSLALSFHSATT